MYMVPKPFRAKLLLYAPITFNISNVWILPTINLRVSHNSQNKQRFFSLNCINRLLFVLEMQHVFYEAQTECLNITFTHLKLFKGNGCPTSGLCHQTLVILPFQNPRLWQRQQSSFTLFLLWIFICAWYPFFPLTSVLFLKAYSFHFLLQTLQSSFTCCLLSPLENS